MISDVNEARAAAHLKPITPREYDVWRQCALGSGLKDTARALGVAVGTIGTMRRSLFYKLGVHSAYQAGMAYESRKPGRPADMRRKTTAHREQVVAAILRGEPLKVAAIEVEVSEGYAWNIVHAAGLTRMYVTAEERAHLMARRAGKLSP